MEIFDLWNKKNEVLHKEYCKNNYEVIDYDNESNICMIFFSSNGLYFPDTKEEFIEKIVVQNRFEWKNMCKSEQLRKYIKRAIFVRDIYKQWYVTGINKEVNTKEKLLIFLEKLCQGYKVVTVGSSSGGYFATLAAMHLKASHCINISGQFFLCKGNGRFVEAKLNGAEQGLDLSTLINESNVPIFYFCPIENDGDREHYYKVEDCSNVRSLLFTEKVHGSTLLNGNLPYVISRSLEELESIYAHYEGRNINKICFLFYTVKFFEAIYIFTKELQGFIERRLKK